MTSESKLLRALQSRKLWAAIVGFVSILWVAYQSGNALDPDTVVNAILGIVAAYIAATAWEDGKAAEALAKPTTTIETPSPNVTVSTTSDKPQSPELGRMG